MKKHLLVYDVDWWVLGKHAQLVNQNYPQLEIMSLEEFYNQLGLFGPQYFNDKFDVISTMCLGIAQTLISNGIRVDSSAAVSYYYFMENHYAFRDWMDQPIYNNDFIKEYLSKIKSIGAINTKLTKILKNISPNANVKYIKQFVDTEHFKPKQTSKNPDEFVIGWVGDTEKYCKNYYTTYLPIVEAFKNHQIIHFKEATMESFISPEDMPDFYNGLDLLIITGNHEGGPAPALEAYACGIPVLSSNIGYVMDVTHPEAQSFIIDSNDPRDFISKINEIIKTRSTLKEVGNTCCQYVNENFSIKNTIHDWVNQLFQYN
ncbi:glycosyltransferase [Bacillus sp. ISL-75]|uniref:glycosyltransferase family 4 protein n=1 Tax=Bacillus sp. ISL-75 TaxID=2819137 RepID=UPI001BE92341|nr:glycosyltransferase [Bacillus sp. ISL-75]MBT2729621.1 glycosyltransferase [Bacillus sp. ISL-75]